MASYIKQFRQIVLELGDQAPDDSALLFMFTEGLKSDVQMQVLLARPQFLSEAEQVAERADMALFSAGKRAQQQGQQQRPRQQSWQQRQFQQYRYQKPPPPPPRTGPVPMDLGVIQGQQIYQQNPPQFTAARQIVCYRCGKQGHMKKDCKVKLREPQQQQIRQNWGQYQPQFGWVQQPPQFVPQPQFYGYPPNFNHLYVPPNFEQPTGTAPLQQPQQQPEAQMPPPPPLNQNGGSF